MRLEGSFVIAVVLIVQAFSSSREDAGLKTTRASFVGIDRWDYHIPEVFAKAA
jgi:hypothetical protein